MIRTLLGLVLIASSSMADEKPQPPKHQFDADKLFEPQHLMTVEIEIGQEDWQALCSQTRAFADALGKQSAESPFTYFKANVVIDGVRITEVGIRKKGFLGSLDESRPSLKIDFAEYKKQSPVKGLDRVHSACNEIRTNARCQTLACERRCLRWLIEESPQLYYARLKLARRTEFIPVR